MKNSKLPQPLRGIVPPMVTPLIDNDTLDIEGIVRLVDHMIAGGVHGIFILGTTGELASLSYRLRHELTEHVCKIVAGRIPVLVGITDTAFQESINLAATAARYGATAVVAAPPYYYTPTTPDLIHYFQHLAEKSPLPVFLYNMPSHTRINLEPAIVRTLSKHHNIIGLKDSSANGTYFQQILHTVSDLKDFSVLMGPEELTAEAVLMGGHGGVNGGANMFPELYVKLYEAAVNKDLEKVSILQKQVMRISSRIYTMGYGGSGYLKGLKCALNVLGLCSDFVAEPMQSFGEEEKKRIREYLDEIKVELKNTEALI